MILNLIWVIFIILNKSLHEDWLDVICLGVAEIILALLNFLSISSFNRCLVPCFFIFQWFIRIITCFNIYLDLKPFYEKNELFKSKLMILVMVLNFLQSLILIAAFYLSYEIDFSYARYHRNFALLVFRKLGR